MIPARDVLDGRRNAKTDVYSVDQLHGMLPLFNDIYADAKLAGIKADPNPAVILGATDQSPYAMAQLYQFLASGGEIQPLHAVRGVLDPDGKLLKRYDKTPAPAQEGDSIAANLITVALQQVVSNGTGRQLIGDGLGRLQSAGKGEGAPVARAATWSASRGATRGFSLSARRVSRAACRASIGLTASASFSAWLVLKLMA